MLCPAPSDRTPKGNALAKKKKPATKATAPSKKQAGLQGMMRALDLEIDKQREAIEVAQQRLKNLEEDRERLRKRIEGEG